MTLVYFLMAVLALLLGLIALRYSLFGLVWVVSGHSFWLFPNMMSDEVRYYQQQTDNKLCSTPYDEKRSSAEQPNHYHIGTHWVA